MSLENVQLDFESLRTSLLERERSLILGDHERTLYDVANRACFSVYIDDMQGRDMALLQEAFHSDTGADKLFDDYIMFRTDTEAFVKQHKERAWTSYIEAITLGDSGKAEEILRKALADEDDDDE